MSRLTIIWTPNALRCVFKAYQFLADTQIEAAQEAAQRIRTGVSILEQFPQAGRPSDDLEPEHRELLIPFGNSGYIALYRVEKDTIVLLSIRHQREVGY